MCIQFWLSLQVFDAGSRTLLRQLKAHKRAAHVAHFAPDRMHVLSAADDTTVSYLLFQLLAVSVLAVDDPTNTETHTTIYILNLAQYQLG